MQLFAATLKKHVQQSGITIQTLSKLSGVERTYIHKLISGERLPSDEYIVNKIVEALMLSSQHASKLHELYLVARMGQGVYARHMQVKKLLEDMGQLHSGRLLPLKCSYSHSLGDLPEAFAEYGTGSVNRLIKALIESEASRPNGHIKIVIQPSCSFILELLTTLGMSYPHLIIEHIFFLQKGMQEADDNAHNLNCFTELAPLMVSGCNYLPMYYYDDANARSGMSELMPFFILTRDGVVALTGNLDRGAFFRSDSLLELYQNFFEGLLALSKPLFNRFSSTTDPIVHYLSMDQGVSRSCFTLMSEPCLAPFLTETHIKKYLHASAPSRDFFLWLCSEHLKDSHPSYPQLVVTSYFTGGGLDNFIKNGVLSEVVHNSMAPVAPADRKILLSSMQAAARLGLYNPCQFVPRSFKMPNNLVMLAFNEASFGFIYKHPVYGALSFGFNERSIAYSVYHFLSYLQTSNYIFSSDQTLSIMEGRLEVLP